jgi:hypothetical protein
MLLFNHLSISKSFVLLFLSFLSLTLRAQVIENPELKKTVLALESTGKQLPVEKLYVHFDKPYYAMGDTIHFKAYLLDANYLTLSSHSRLLYIEMDDRDNVSVKRIMVPVASGLSWGDLALTEKNFPPGNYTLRAYTNWMRNFGEDYVFDKNFYISPAISRSFMVNTAFKLSGNSIEAKLQFNNLDKQPLSGQLQLQVMNDKKSLHKDMITLTAGGQADVNFTVPEKADIKHLYLIATEVSKGSSNRSATIPVMVSRPDNTDIKFAVEGGAMVTGLPAHIAFKAMGEDGKGADISGAVLNSKQQQVATFRSAYKGIGSFNFTPQAGETYTAKIGSGAKSFPLPVAGITGTALSIDSKNKDSLLVTIRSAVNTATDNYYLIAEARGVVCYAESVNFKNGVSKISAAKALFPTGVARFTLLNNTHQVLNERMVYIDHQDNLRLNISSSKPTYGIRNSIYLGLQAIDKDNQTVKGIFSVSVTDNSQVKIDDNATNLENYLLLTSDLKDQVEDPGYYFSKPAPQSDLDNLLLVQTPTGHSWKQVFNPQTPNFGAETKFVIQGKVTNFSDKPVPNTQIALLSKKPVMAMDAITDEKGLFTFKDITPLDTPIYFLQAKNLKGKNDRVVIDVNEFKPPVFTTSSALQAPWYVNSDSTLLNGGLGQIAKNEIDLNLKGHLLNEVKIVDSKIIKYSLNLNGPGQADQTLTVEDMDKANKMTLLELLQQKIDGFGTGTIDLVKHRDPTAAYASFQMIYKIHEKEVRFIVDGDDLKYVYIPPQPFPHPPPSNPPGHQQAYMDLTYKNFLDGYFQYFTADQIEGLEVMYNQKFSRSYIGKFIPLSLIDPDQLDKYAFIEITTRSGMGPLAKKTPGSYVYKPIPFTLPKPFQGPVYTAKNNTTDGVITDTRATIQWVPNIVTDRIDKTSTSFYSADSPGSYTITVEGIDLNGEPGYQQQKIEIKPK